MARARPEPSPLDLFLAPVADLARRQPAIEALVFWHQDGWPDHPTEALEAEEIAFYVEGLLDEGFDLEWRIMGAGGMAAAEPDHVALYVWQDAPSGPPASGPGWGVLARARWGVAG